MEWRDTGILLHARPHGETAVIAEAFTAEHGKHAGVVRGGISRKMKPILQPGAQVSLVWSARLEDHLGAFRVELEGSRTAAALADRLTLEATNALCALLRMCLPDREPMPRLYRCSVRLFDALGPGDGWLADYVRWEVALIEALGFGLDLTACAADGSTEALIYVSPKTGRAVSAGAGAPYADRLLPLPAFLRDPSSGADPAEVLLGLEMTGFFLSRHILPALGIETMPDARGRLQAVLRKRSG